MPVPQMPPQSPQSSFLGAAQQGGSSPAPVMQGAPPQGPDPQMLQMLMQAAKMGRGGDTLLAHLTPGEKTVPPEVQTPKVLATLNKAYKDKGVSPEQFTVGSPQSSTNPSTGLHEYNFMSAFLPMALGLAGSALFPAIAPAALSGLAASSVGAGLGSTAGGLLAGQKPLQAGLGGLGSGLGGYALGSMFEPAKDAATAASGMTPGPNFAPSDISRMTDMFAGNNPAVTAPAAMGNPDWTKLGGALPGGFNPAQAAGSFAGGQVGSYLGQEPKPYTAPRPKGFDDKFVPDNRPWNQQMGMTNYNGPQANFNGFNPATNYPAAWRFF